MFLVFHLAWSTQQEHLLWVEENAARWLVDLLDVDIKQVASLMTNKQQSQTVLLKVDPRSTFRSNFLQPVTKIVVARQVDTQGEKRATSTLNLQWNNVGRQADISPL